MGPELKFVEHRRNQTCPVSPDSRWVGLMEGFTEEGRVVQARVQKSNALLLLNYNVSSVTIVEKV